MGTSLAAELQKALFDLLRGDTQLKAALGGANIFEQVPANVIFPYLTFGRTSIYDWSTATESASEQLLTLHVWSKAKSKQETQAILRLIRQRLDAGSLALGSHHPVNLRFEFSEIRYDDDLSVHHGLVRYRAMIEGAA